MNLPRWPILIGATALGGLAVGVMGRLISFQLDKIAHNADFVSRAISITRSQPAIDELIGERFEVGRATFSDEFGRIDEKNAQIRLPILGDKDKAFLYAYARRKDKKDSYRLFKLEAEFFKIKGKRLILLDRSNEDPTIDEAWELEQRKRDEENISKKNEQERVKSKKELIEEERKRIKSMTKEERKKYHIEQLKKFGES